MRGKPRRFPNMFLNKGITPADAGKTTATYERINND